MPLLPFRSRFDLTFPRYLGVLWLGCLLGSAVLSLGQTAPDDASGATDPLAAITPRDSSDFGADERDSTLRPTGPWAPRPITNWAFGVGESLSYSIGWEKIVAGRGEMIVGNVVDTLGRLCYPVLSTVRSTPFFSAFYKVDDRVSTLMDARELFPLRFEKHLSEGRYRQNRRVEFDPELGVALTSADTFAVPPYVLDDLSLLYYVRTLAMTPGRDIELDIYSGKKLYRLTVRVIRRERIAVAAGTFSTIVVEPLLQAAGLFKHEGKVTVWLTDDRLHLPVLMKSKVVVGSIIAELEEYRLGQIRQY
ncbi:MAG: DUF3108 domain-containing protein [Candidatus Zixiibacteriota bacterium]